MKQKLLNKLWLRVGMIVAIMTTALSGTVWADEAVFDFTSMSAITAGQQSFTEGNITITCSQGAVALQNSTMQLRWYSGQTLTVSAASGYVVSAISITKGASDKGTISVTSGGGSFNENNWTGSAASVTLSSAGQSRVTNITVTYQSAGGTPTCATPTFSPAAGAVVSGTEVEISTTTDGATIYYTTNEQNPTTNSNVYSAPIEITAATTIKAIAVKDGYNNSAVAEAAYTIKQAVSGYNIDFENDIDAYIDWETENIGIHTTGVTSAHSGSAWGSNVNANDNATQTAIIKTKAKVAYPDKFTCYISKESSNTTSSSWKIQVSSDGTSWTDIATLSSMTQNTWTEFTGDIKAAGHTNVYVRLYYSGSSAKRAVDDISLTTYTPAAVEEPVISVTTPFTFSTTATITCVTEGATIYYSYDNSTWTEYTEGLSITSTTTIYAKAVKGSDESTVAQVTATKELATPTVEISATSFNIGETATVTTDGPDVTLATSDATVASVSGTTVTGVAAGTATITATWAANSDYSGGTQNFTVTVTDPNAPGSVNNPYTVAEAIAATPASGTSDNVYIHGIVSAFHNTSIVGDGNNYRYYISDDGTTTDQLLVYKGKKNSTDNFSDAGDLEIGDVVIIYGGLTTYNNAAEVASGNYIVSRTTKTANDLTKTGDIALSEADLTATATATDYFTTSSTGALSYEIANTSVATVNAAGVVTPVAAGTTTLTVSQAADATYKAGSLEITVIVAAASLNSTTIVANASGSTTYGTNKEEDYMIDNTYDGTVAAVSSNPSVATVTITQPNVDGEGTFSITPVAVGTAVITISAPATATCEAATDVTYTITVIAPAGKTTAAPTNVAPVTIDFTGNAFNLSTSNTDTTTGDITDGTYTLNVSGGNGAYYYGDGDALLMGKTGATLSLPTFSNEITKIEVTGSSKAGTSVKQNIYVGETPVSTETTGAKDVTNEYIIDSDYQTAGTQYLLKVTSNHNTQISSITFNFASADITTTLNGSGYATYCSQYPLDFSDYATADYSAWQITGVSGETITFSQITGSVKGGTGVLLKGTAGETITLTSANSTNELSGNKLEGTLAPTYVADEQYYGLSGSEFVKVNAGTVPAGKALLPASALSSSVKAFTFVFEDDATGIEETLSNSPLKGENIYNLAGQMVNGESVNGKLPKGIYIVNGKKVMVK